MCVATATWLGTLCVLVGGAGEFVFTQQNRKKVGQWVGWGQPKHPLGYRSAQRQPSKHWDFYFFYCYYSINMEVLPNLNFAKFRGEADTSRHLSSLELGHLSKVRSFLCPVERRSFSLNLALAEVSEYHSPRDFCSCSRGTAGEKRVSLKRPMVLVVPLRQTRVKP